jgi:hypothetical protein
MQELEAKRVLELQLQEKEGQKTLKKFEDLKDQNYLQKDIQSFSQ